jgi:hypothetical protein
MLSTTWRPGSQRQILFASCLTLAALICLNNTASANQNRLLAESTSKAVSASNSTQSTFSQLKELLQSTKYLRRSALDMVNEVEQNKWVVSTFPEDLSIATPSVDVKKGKSPNEDLIPASKKWTAYIINQMTPLIGTLKKDIDAISVPENKQGTTKDDLDKLDAYMQKLETNFETMKNLCATDKLDNMAIGKQAVGIYDLCGKIEDLVPTISHDLRDSN